MPRSLKHTIQAAWRAVTAIVAIIISDHSAAQPPARQVPADGKIVLTDYGIRDWGPEPISYKLDAKAFPTTKLALTSHDGNTVPFQIENGVLTFVAALPKGASVTYSLAKSDKDHSSENSTIKISEKSKELEIGNEFISVLVPKPGDINLPQARPAAEVEGPLKGWKPKGFDKWIGATRFVTDRRISTAAFRLSRRGPAVCEYEARYSFSPRGKYVWRLQIAGGMPIIRIVEEFDAGEITDGKDFLVVELHKGWTPQNILWIGQQPEGQNIPTGAGNSFAQYLEQKRVAQPVDAPVGGTGQAPAPAPPEKGLFLLDRTVPAGKWGGYVGGAQIWDGDPNNPLSGPNLAFVPLFVGSWRRTMAINAWHKDGTGIVLALPISVRRIRWSLDIADDFSPFSTHEHDPDLPETYGRRVWGLYVGDRVQEAQARFGYIGLDRYKDWIVDLPDPPKDKAPPRPFYPPALIEAIKPRLAEHPDAWALSQWYLFSGNVEHAVKNALKVINGLKNPYGENSFYVTGLTHYRQSQFRVDTMLAEDALACPDLPDDLRRELRRWLALYANLNSEPDFNPRGAGVHLGNNNMSFNRSFALTYYASLLPDHPRYEEWMEGLTRHFLFKIATQTAVDGPFIECPTYQLYSPARTLNVTLNALRNLGRIDAATAAYHERTLWYLANLTMPDPRYDNRRIIPGMGNSANRLESIFGVSMTATTDAQYAGFLRFVHGLTKGHGLMPPAYKGFWAHADEAEPYVAWYRPDIPAKPATLSTTIMPTYGVVFRSRFNSPDEVAMLFRAGMNWSHWDTDSLNVILYGLGAPLSPGTGYQYLGNPAPQQDNGIYHNRVKVGARDLQEVFGRVDDAVVDYEFSDGADYAVAERFYPSQLFKDGKGAMCWRRHVMFVKTPDPQGRDYFVIRDTFPGGEQRHKWWNWLNLDTADLISVDEKPFDAAAVPVNKAVPEDQFPRQTGRTIEMKTKYGASTWFWFSRPVEVRIRMTFDYPRQDGVGGTETKTIVEIPAAADEDFFCVVWPKKDGEALPQCEPISPDGIKVSKSGTSDYVFASDKVISYNANAIRFEGNAGVVRNAGGKAAVLLTVKPKERRTLDLGRGVKITGEMPFSANLEGDSIRISTEGRTRVLHMTQPEWMLRPQLWIDGTEWMACWTDYPASGWGTYDNTWLIGITIPEGKHTLAVKNMQYPKPWPCVFRCDIGQ